MRYSSVVTVTPPAAEPVTLAEAKLWAKIDGTDEDALCASLLTAAIESAEQYTHRAFINRTVKFTIDAPRCAWADNLPDGVYDLPISVLSGALPESIKLPLEPVVSVTSVTTYSTGNAASVYSASNYYVDTGSGRLVLNETASWPSDIRQRNACEVVYVAGYGATSTSVSAPIKTAILMHFAKMYDGRIYCDMPEGCMKMLNQYKVYGL